MTDRTDLSQPLVAPLRNEPAAGNPGEARRQRLAAALRANLVRRKAQARARVKADGRGDGTGDAAAEPVRAGSGRDLP